MRQKFKFSLMALAVSQVLVAGQAYAAEEDATTTAAVNDEVETIQVRGFASSLSKSLRGKRFSESSVEIVSTDDLGLLPDVSITDSLVRLPGIAASRDRGNASQISIRGMGPRLNVATMNNREIVSAEPSRNVRFEHFPAELIDSVEVYKSPMANKAEGGISGLVNMNFVSPLSRDKRQIAFGGSMMHNTLASDLPGEDGNGYKANFSYVDQLNETFGFAVGLTYQDQPSLEQGVESWDYNNGADRGDLNGNGKLDHAPWGVVAKSKRGNNERMGGMAILEWKPTDSLHFKADVFYSEFEIQERDDQFGPGNLGNWQNGSAWYYEQSGIDQVFIDKADGSEHLVQGGVRYDSDANSAMAVYAPTWFQENQMLSTGLHGKYLGDVWTISADVGLSKASIDSVWVNIKPFYVGGALDIGFNLQNGEAAEILVQEGAEDLANPDNYALGASQEVWVETSPGVWEPIQQFSGASMEGDGDRELTDEMVNLNLDFERDVEWGLFDRLYFGGRYTDRTKENQQLSWWSKTASADHGLTDFGMTYEIGGDYNVPAIYTFKDWDQVADAAFGGASAPEGTGIDQLASWELKEANSAAYVMLSMEGDLFDIPFTGNVGVRYVRTDVESIGHEQDENWNVTPVSVEHDYSELLPALNMLFNVTNDFQVRLGMARTLSRPPLLEMRTGFSLNRTSLPPTASGGNPTLDPYIADQIDLGLEYYWGDNSSAALNLFYKDLSSHIGLAQDTVTFNGEEYQYTGSVNGEGGVIQGFEVLYQQAFDFLPEPLDGLGVFANYSYTDSEVMEFKPEENPYALAGLSEHIGSVTLWYAKDAFDARLSYNYRSEFTGINSWDPSRVNLNDAETTMDASIGYQITDELKVTLQAQNLTNEASVSYWDNDKDKLAKNVEWGRRFLIGFNYAM